MLELSEAFVVESSFRLPGLGLLVLPLAPEPSWLAAYELHTAFTVLLPASLHPPSSIIGTLEEIAHDSQATRRALLLDFNPDISLPLGTCLQVTGNSLDLY